MAAGEGFEPSHTESESAVLPLHKPAISCPPQRTDIIIQKRGKVMEVRYFDNSATTRIKEEVLTEMFPYLSREYGNPSSLYSIGRKSKRAIEEARKRVASLINCQPEEIYFTSCGSESDNTALKGIEYANQNKGKHIITSKIEHPAILHSCQNLENKGFEVTYLDVDKDGFVNLETLEHSIRTDTA